MISVEIFTFNYTFGAKTIFDIGVKCKVMRAGQGHQAFFKTF